MHPMLLLPLLLLLLLLRPESCTEPLPMRTHLYVS
jgi:hypothetical protein